MYFEGNRLHLFSAPGKAKMYFLIDWIAWGRVKRRSLLTLVLNPSYPLYDHPKEEEKGQEKNRWSRDSSIWLTLCGKCNILPIMMSWEGTYRWLASSIKGNSLSSLITRLICNCLWNLAGLGFSMGNHLMLVMSVMRLCFGLGLELIPCVGSSPRRKIAGSFTHGAFLLLSLTLRSLLVVLLLV